VVWATKAGEMSGTEKKADKIVQTALPTKPAKDKSDFFKRCFRKKIKKAGNKKR
jgi:hypothetical protein